MFWDYNKSSDSEVDCLFQRGNFTLHELLEQTDIIQECKSQNKKLIEYLSCGNVLAELIDLTINEPSADLEESQRFKDAHIAAELLSCCVPQMNEKISGDEALLNKLYSFLEVNEAPLNSLLASFFSKAFGVLVTRNSSQDWYHYQLTCIMVLEFLKKKDFVSHVVKHMGTSAIPDLVLKLLTSVEFIDSKQGFIDWLNDKRLIELVIGLLDSTFDRDVHDNASRLVVGILRVSRERQYMPASERCVEHLLTTLERPATVELLLTTLFGPVTHGEDEQQPASPSESAIVNGISILLALLESRKAVNDGFSSMVAAAVSVELSVTFDYKNLANNNNDDQLSSEELAQQRAIRDVTMASIVPRLTDFAHILRHPPSLQPVKTTIGLLDPPLGQARLSIIKLITTLLALNNADANAKLMELRIIDIILDLFFKYSLNNMLHTQVERSIHHIFNYPVAGVEDDEAAMPENPLLVHLYSDCRLVSRVLDAWQENVNSEAQQQPGLKRKGYMGHLTRIANLMNDTADNSVNPYQKLVQDQMSKLPDETRQEWNTFVSGKLRETNERNVIVPVVRYANTVHSSEDENTDSKDLHFSHGSASQQIYLNYQIEQMSDQPVDAYCFPDDSFNGNEECGSKRTTSFGLEEPSLCNSNKANQEDVFEALCQQRFSNYPGDFDEDNVLSKRRSSPDKMGADKTEPEGHDETDPWEDRTCELSFASPSAAEKLKCPIDDTKPNQSISPIRLSPSQMAANEGDASSPASATHFLEWSDDNDDGEEQNTGAKAKPMDVDQKKSDKSGDPFWNEDDEDGVPVSMDTGNPWVGPEASADTKPLSATVSEPSDRQDDNATEPTDSSWAKFAVPSADGCNNVSGDDTSAPGNWAAAASQLSAAIPDADAEMADP